MATESTSATKTSPASDKYDRIPTVEDYRNYYGNKIKNDETALNMLFLGCSSTYTNDPTNIFLKGVSSIGKTFIPVTISTLFPKQDVWMLGGLSPKSLIHDYGVDVDGDTLEPIDLEPPDKNATKEEKKEYREKRRKCKTLIDLNNKILIFLEAPQLETFNILRPILSHDHSEIEFKFVDKGMSGMRTKKVIIRGWPATVFCSTNEQYMEELSTRSITITPNMAKDKFFEANMSSAKEFAYILSKKKTQEEMWLSEYLTRQRGSAEVLIPYAENLAKTFPHDKPRHMRDFKTFLRLVKAHASLSRFTRPIIVRGVTTDDGNKRWDDYIMATHEDMMSVLKIFGEAYETTITGLPQQILTFFHEVCRKVAIENGYFTISQAVDFYNINTTDKKSSQTIRWWLKSLEAIGWVTSSSMSEIDPEADKRQIAFKLTDEVKNTSSVTDIILSSLFSKDKFKTWLDTLMNNSSGEYRYRLNLGNIRAEIIDVDKMYNIVYPPLLLSEISIGQETKPEADNKPETILDVKSEIIVDNYGAQINPLDAVNAKITFDFEPKPIIATPPKPGGKEDSEAHGGRNTNEDAPNDNNDIILHIGDPMSTDPSARDAKSADDDSKSARPPSSPKLVRCACGAGPWNEGSNFALDHIAMMAKANETGHELVEFEFIDDSEAEEE